jgi:hypothetical protein
MYDKEKEKSTIHSIVNKKLFLGYMQKVSQFFLTNEAK